LKRFIEEILKVEELIRLIASEAFIRRVREQFFMKVFVFFPR
jgi:hypothetical protein